MMLEIIGLIKTYNTMKILHFIFTILSFILFIYFSHRTQMGEDMIIETLICGFISLIDAIMLNKMADKQSKKLKGN